MATNKTLTSMMHKMLGPKNSLISICFRCLGQKISSLEVGIVGVPNIGKSTIFNALTNGNAEASNFPFCTIDPNHGIMKVIDPTLHIINKYVPCKQLVQAEVRLIDIAGLVRGASV